MPSASFVILAAVAPTPSPAAQTAPSTAFSPLTFILGILASLLVGMVLFVLGQRAGKNQADRAELRELYRRLLVHFQAFQSGIHSGDPVRPSHTTVPLVAQLRKEGRLHLLLGIGLDIEQLENDLLAFGWEFNSALDDVWVIGIDKLQAAASVQLVNNGMIEVGTPVRAEFSYLEFPLGTLLAAEDQFGAMCSAIGSYTTGLWLTQLGNNTINRRKMTAHPNFVPSGLVQWLSDTRTTALALPEVAELKVRESELVASLGTTIEILRKRVAEPHPLRESIGQGIRDIFRD